MSLDLLDGLRLLPDPSCPFPPGERMTHARAHKMLVEHRPLTLGQLHELESLPGVTAKVDVWAAGIFLREITCDLLYDV